MVGKDSKVVLVDSDSFQINALNTVYLCDAGTQHFTPPELQSLTSFAVIRTVNHDNFGLALLIFHLLFGARHPYAGVPLQNSAADVELESNINMTYAKETFKVSYAFDAS